MIETPVVIVGGGISGLSAAYYLGRAGIESVLLEQSPRFGGLIQTESVLGCTLEAGPDSFISTKPALQDLAQNLGIADALLPSNDERRRVFLVKKGRLLALPPGMVLIAPSDLGAADRSELFSPETKQRFWAELDFAPHGRQGDFSVRELVQEHFGEEVLSDVTEPLLAGVYGGSAGALSARSVLPRFVEYERSLGSLIRGVQGERQAARDAGKGSAALFQSFSRGMGQPINELIRVLPKTTSLVQEKALRVEESGGSWLVRTVSEIYRAQHLVLAVAAFQAAELLAGNDAELASELNKIPYSSAILCNLLFRAEEWDLPLDGFGFLVPTRERQLMAAATWINTKFPSRIAPGLVAIRVFLVDPEASAEIQAEDAGLTGRILEDLHRIMGVIPKPIFSKLTRWPKSLPQYIVGHQERVDRIRGAVKRKHGFHLTSNYLDGVGIPDCVRLAADTVEAIRSSLKNP